MSIDERDYMYEPKQFRKDRNLNSNEPNINGKEAYINEEAYWRRISIRQQKQKRNLIILAVGIIALVWFFGDGLSRYFKSLSWSEIQGIKTVLITPFIAKPHPSVPELQFPESGSVIQYQTSSNVSAKFTIVSAQGGTKNCLVKLEKWNDGLPVIEIFVRVGEQAETQLVPLGDYRARIACGTQWYGRSDLFGSGTSVSVGELPLKFWQSGSAINGNTLTLTNVVGGNFKTNNSNFNKF